LKFSPIWIGVPHLRGHGRGAPEVIRAHRLLDPRDAFAVQRAAAANGFGLRE
jgi:hypothetical protein